ncbi:MAG: conserved hypothetical protein (putative transposase or invertase) [Candidatus Kentron sp. G]|nr:MAG: conserved hypothetical protein (putative transposase or invertase) [Candidatus Kentron sp. G]VFM98473.1 MAG: conserved hypothetical protein (putative transposase or invertase) [Candidatus Kentron sp. G]VFN00874.1 MAG: conserved hypothetical protein (putative transposase or invertase) [Candidatus Kentron sp. G]
MIKKPGRKIITFDWAIKTVLRDKANFDVLEGFLTALFGRSITILDMLESESNRTDEAAKYNRVDLLAKAEDGERIIVEVQYFSEMGYLRRLAYGTAKTIVENLKLGEPYENVTKVYSVSLLYFDISKDGDDYIYHGKTEFTGLHTHQPVTLKKSLTGDPVRINETNVFPEYYLIPLRAFPDVIRDELDQWVYAFKNNEVLDEFTAPGIGALKEKLDYLKMDENERRRFDKHMDTVRSEWGMIASARLEGREEGREEGIEEGIEKGIKKGREEGLEEGRAEGLEKGREEGLEEGIEKGRKQERQKHEEERKILVGSLYKNGMSIPVIAASIGFPEALIRRWLEEG